ncbi:tetratricopeptide repeat-containing sulfotransferase family protein [Vannielia litorea]|uniref:Flp pilus assembly protein TadD, contains TPR repeats n=1 Tax=Vannielia litorea TaxID=1217970 RepID=A0A1N6HCK8_9RHOB|nr:sulfotransferase [Vannielia litorea]SIO17427.1 Flp pilus assembly protein TadD, contains TPR repeats [Vannielia litorea]
MASFAIKDIPKEYQRALKLHTSGRLREAHQIYNEIVAVRPQTAEAHYQIGRIAREVRDFKVAVAALNRALQIKGKEPVVLRELAQTLSEAGDTEEALRAFLELAKLNTRDYDSQMDIALLLQRLGQFDEAEKHFRKALRILPGNGVAYRAWLQGKKVKAGEPVIREMMEAYSNPKIQGRMRSDLCFALAKAMEDTKQYNKVFKFLKEGNRIIGDTFPFDKAGFDHDYDSILNLQAPMVWRKEVPPLDNESFAPIVVTGLPRSGTTLVEQIVASHSSVEGGGEIGVLSKMIRLAMSDEKTKDWRKTLSINDKQYEAFPARLEHEFRKRVTFDKLVTDKTISNFRYIGMIRELVPNARIIVVRRDPRDQLLSIYKNVFAENTHTYAYDLDNLALYYSKFVESMEFWRKTLPEAFTEIAYEKLVNDPEVQSRKLIAAAGLDWEDACLEFHKAKRDVKTLSIHQVRQPMYTSSARAWEKYADDLKPLTEALERHGVLDWHYQT